jgi:hypothetical protein
MSFDLGGLSAAFGMDPEATKQSQEDQQREKQREMFTEIADSVGFGPEAPDSLRVLLMFSLRFG